MRIPISSNSTQSVGNRSSLFTTVISIFSGIILWELVGQFLDFRFFPPFSTVITATYDVSQEPIFWEQLSVSVQSLVLGYLIAATGGVFIGILSGLYQTVEYFFEVYVTVLLSTPKLVFAPVLLSIFGTNRTSQVVLIVLYAMPIIIVNSMAGIHAVKQSWVEMAQAFGATTLQRIDKVIIPGALPLVLTGLSIGISRAVSGMVAGEMFIAFIGIGALLRQRGNRFDVAGVWGILVVIVLLSIIILAVFNRLTSPIIRRYHY